MSEDEFDNIPDDFADAQGIDWAQLLAGPPLASRTHSEHPAETEYLQPSISPQPSHNSSSSYFSDGDDMDSSFLAELDRVEQGITGASQMAHSRIGVGDTPEAAALQTTRETSSIPPVPGSRSLLALTSVPQSQLQGSSEVRSSHYFTDQTADRSASPQNFRKTETRNWENVKQFSIVPSKRARSEDSLNPMSPKRRGKMKADDKLQQILSTYEDEFTCPICCDIFVASHVGNPCGHTFCGECGWQWHIENGNKGCPCCRGTLDKSMPMIPNIAMDNTVEKHVRALALSGIEEWEPAGQKFREWHTRKQAWRMGAAKRERKKARQKSKSVVSLGTIQVFDVPQNWFHNEDNLNADPTYEESDAELIPRPIQRARRQRRQGGGGAGVVNVG